MGGFRAMRAFLCVVAVYALASVSAAPLAGVPTGSADVETYSSAPAVETQAEKAKDGSASLACTFMKCPKDTPYCANGMCKKHPPKKGDSFDFSKYTAGSKQFTGSFTKPDSFIKGGPGGADKDKKGGAGGFGDYSKYTKSGGAKGGKGGFDFSKYTKGGGAKGGKGGFDFSKYTGGKGSGDKGGKGGFDFSKYTKGSKGGKGGFDFSKYTGGKGSGDKGGKGGFDFSKYTKGGGG